MRRGDGAQHTWRDRGASIVEYALIMALFVTVLVGSMEALTGSTGDEFDSTGDRIGHPEQAVRPSRPVPTTTAPGSGGPTTTVPLVTTTTRPAVTTTTIAATTTTPPRPAVITSASCSGTLCTFAIDAAPGTTIVWSTNGGTDEGSSFAPRYPNEPGTGFLNLGSTTSSYGVSVEIQPGGQVITGTVTCSGSWVYTTCTVS